MNDPPKPEVSIKRLGKGRYLHSIIPILDSTGKVVQRIAKPLMVELRVRDVVQILVGSTLLAIPVAYTEEAWNLGATLPMRNIVILAIISILLIATFVYASFYRYYLQGYVGEYIKRVLTIYVGSLVVVSILLTLLEQCPWGVDNLLAIKRIVIVALPASLSATITDSLK
jgi:uncharacterized membrane protein